MLCYYQQQVTYRRDDMLKHGKKKVPSMNEGDNIPSPMVGDRVFISPFHPGGTTKYDGKYAFILKKSKTRYRLRVEGLKDKGIYRWCAIKDAKKVSVDDSKDMHEGEKIMHTFQKQLEALIAKTNAISKEKGVENFVNHHTISTLMEMALQKQKKNELDINRQI